MKNSSDLNRTGKTTARNFCRAAAALLPLAALTCHANAQTISRTARPPNPVFRFRGGTLLVGDFGNGMLSQFDLDANNALSNSADGVTYPYAIVADADGSILVASVNTVQKFDGKTGASPGAFVKEGSGGLRVATGTKFGPDGNLCVSSGFQDGNGSAARFDGAKGNYIDMFVLNNRGGLSSAAGLTFGSDGVLYVVSEATNTVLAFNGKTGALLGTVGTTGGTPYGILFRPASSRR